MSSLQTTIYSHFQTRKSNKTLSLSEVKRTRLIDADALDYELGANDRDIYVKACLDEALTVEIISSDTRSEIINYLYEFNARADIKIESLIDDVILMIKHNLENDKA